MLAPRSFSTWSLDDWKNYVFLNLPKTPTIYHKLIVEIFNEDLDFTEKLSFADILEDENLIKQLSHDVLVRLVTIIEMWLPEKDRDYGSSKFDNNNNIPFAHNVVIMETIAEMTGEEDVSSDSEMSDSGVDVYRKEVMTATRASKAASAALRTAIFQLTETIKWSDQDDVFLAGAAEEATQNAAASARWYSKAAESAISVIDSKSEGFTRAMNALETALEYAKEAEKEASKATVILEALEERVAMIDPSTIPLSDTSF